MAKPILAQELIKQTFNYENGKLYWKNNKGISVKAGDLAGKKNKSGHWVTCVDYKLYYNHRLIFMMFHGYCPDIIDHIDGNPENNLIENLRKATSSQNRCNSKTQTRSKSGIKGVTWHKPTSKWLVHITIDGKTKHGGLFEDIQKAKEQSEHLRKLHHGEFARL